MSSAGNVLPEGSGGGNTGPRGGATDGGTATGVAAPEAPVLSLRHAAKAFGAVQAVVDASIELRAGEAHASVTRAAQI